ncbi:hypothetical protein BKA70DRAFT_1318466 [Coprinopsis sp. MPI-PUGE-AT-0042]|nr:hypothetical protein BKA70DRAFT_1318466 [Coprinopsis sp. MPI-PUGE-AT-0042]
MGTGLRATEAACIKIAEVVVAGGAAPEAERQLIIKGLGGARDALNRLDSGDQAVRGRLRQAKASLRQTIVTGNKILANCGVGRDDGAATSVAETSTVATGAASVSVTDSGVALPTASATDSVLLSGTARPTASSDLLTGSSAAPIATAEPSVAPPQVAPEVCPPAATVTVVSTFPPFIESSHLINHSQTAAAAPAVTVTVTAGDVASGIASSAVALRPVGANARR